MFPLLKKPAVVLTVALLVYVCLYYAIGIFFGNGMAIAAVFPVVVVAWFFGVFWGVTAALLSIVVNLALGRAFEFDWERLTFDQGTVFIGVGAMVFIAWMIGLLRTLRLHNQKTFFDLSREIEERRATEAELRDLMRFSDNVLESSVDSIVVGDERGNIIRINQAALALSGYGREEIIGKSHAALTHIVPGEYRSITGETITVDEAYQASSLALQAQLYETGSIECWEYYLVRKDGQLIPVEGNIVMLRNADGGVAGSLAIIRDISGRRLIEKELAQHRERLHELVQAKTAQLRAREQELQATNQQLLAANEQLQAANSQLRSSEQALRESEERFRAVVQLAGNEAIIIIDEQGIITFWNQGAEKIYGYTQEEILGKSVVELTPPETRKGHETMLTGMPARNDMPGMQGTVDGMGVRKDGGLFPCELSITRWETAGVRMYGFIVRDITARKEAEADLRGLNDQQRESREFLENIFRTTNDGIVVSDTDGNILRVNTTIEKLLGYDEKEMIGVSAMDFFPQEGGFRRQGLEMAALLRSEGSVQNWETEWCRKDGSRLPVEINISFLRDRQGKASGAVAAVRDISERRVIEQHLLQTEKLKSLGEMASGVAHDFNNMLTAILGRAQLVKRMLGAALAGADTDKAAEIEKGLAVIEDAALDGAETVRRIQDFSRAGTGQRFTEAVDLTEVVRGALEYTRTRWKDDAELKGLRYCIENTLTGPITVVGNASELREVFTNLINNSLDAMPKGGTLSIGAVCDTQMVTITVQDTGTGIPRQLIDRIFDPFFTTKGPQSTGLGMSVSYGIIRRHNGSISASSDEGKGASLSIVLPLGRAELPAQTESEPVAQGAALHVLVIDDDEDVREVLVDMLTSIGHRVESATDGPTGLEMFRATPFDLVFTDLGMPGISGWDVAREIKSIREQTLLALVTGWDVQYQQETVEEHRIDFVLNKPFQVSHIMDVVSISQKRLNGVF